MYTYILIERERVWRFKEKYEGYKFFTVCCSIFQGVAGYCRVLQGFAGCCIVLQCVAVCCSVLQCVAV